MDYTKIFNSSILKIILVLELALQIDSVSHLQTNIFKETLEFLNTKNDLAVKSVVVISNELGYCFDKTFTPKDMINTLSNRKEPMPFSLVHISKTTKSMDWMKGLKKDQNLIILCDLRSMIFFDELTIFKTC